MPLRTSPLILSAITLVCLFAMACSHGAQPSLKLNLWGKLIQKGDLTLNDLQTQIGFQLILPSYLPDEKREYLPRAVQGPTAFPYGGKGDVAQASVTISPLPAAEDQTAIEITEWRPAGGESRLDSGYVEDSSTIGGIPVVCYVDPNYLLWGTPPGQVTPPPNLGPSVNGPGSVYPSYVCFWGSEHLHIVVSFSWSPPQAVPNQLTSDMRGEAMKVVTSMIEDPYTP